ISTNATRSASSSEAAISCSGVVRDSSRELPGPRQSWMAPKVAPAAKPSASASSPTTVATRRARRDIRLPSAGAGRSRRGGLAPPWAGAGRSRRGGLGGTSRLPRYAQYVADAGHRGDERRAVLVDLAPQIADVRLHLAVVAAEVVLPVVVQELPLRQHPA